MNRTELQKDFYKRFTVSPHRLVFSRAGLLCTLLGHSNIPHSEFISCTLSMCVQVNGRRLDSDTIKLENTKTGICTVFRIDDLFRQKGSSKNILCRFNPGDICGAEMLYDSTIPQIFSNHAPLRAAVLNTLLKLSDTEFTNERKALICSGENNASPYAAMFSSKKGWCSAVIETEVSKLPLPLTSYKLLAVQTGKRQNRSIPITVKNGFDTLHRIYPHTVTMNDLSFDMLDYAKSHLKPQEMSYIRHIVSENERIKAAKSALKACRIGEFAETVNASQRSIERLWSCPDEHVFLADTALKTDCCLFARQWKSGIIAAVEEDKVDYVINLIRRAYSPAYGCNPQFCVSGVCGTE